jgi:stearoyl-CoA desaturase (delta-9 desaturase)
MGWLFHHKINMERVGDRSNAMDMYKDPFYRHLERRYLMHIGGQLALLYALGGFPVLVWGGALRIVWSYHITWFINSAAHMWGDQTYNTGDLSRNNCLLGILVFGEGWHNNHHAFEWSARHGLEWWQIDMIWLIIRLLEACGLATNVKLPSEKQKARLAF